ncbi:MAG TPA: methylated-DNA--[protein]-cysteine S-methyltransferase [Acidimicrobiia bacterium]|jgi:methylated-DNA-[protein]-cysteine S-methyltransferase
MRTTTMHDNRIYSHVQTPIGRILLAGRPGVLTGLFVASHDRCPPVPSTWRRDDDGLAGARQQLEGYFAGTRTVFDLPLELEGTPFQVAVWSALRNIPYGETISYGELARRVGRPGASRAVGAANGRNPISIVVPCHRVIGADGRLRGYGWGNERKAWLLDHERADGLMSSGTPGP